MEKKIEDAKPRAGNPYARADGGNGASARQGRGMSRLTPDPFRFRSSGMNKWLCLLAVSAALLRATQALADVSYTYGNCTGLTPASCPGQIYNVVGTPQCLTSYGIYINRVVRNGLSLKVGQTAKLTYTVTVYKNTSLYVYIAPFQTAMNNVTTLEPSPKNLISWSGGDFINTTQSSFDIVVKCTGNSGNIYFYEIYDSIRRRTRSVSAENNGGNPSGAGIHFLASTEGAKNGQTVSYSISGSVAWTPSATSLAITGATSLKAGRARRTSAG